MHLMHLVPQASVPGSAEAEYWLRQCDGFRVDGPDGRIGVVDHVEHGLEADVVEAQPGWRRIVVRRDIAER